MKSWAHAYLFPVCCGALLISFFLLITWVHAQSDAPNSPPKTKAEAYNEFRKKWATTESKLMELNDQAHDLTLALETYYSIRGAYPHSVGAKDGFNWEVPLRSGAPGSDLDLPEFPATGEYYDGKQRKRPSEEGFLLNKMLTQLPADPFSFSPVGGRTFQYYSVRTEGTAQQDDGPLVLWMMGPDEDWDVDWKRYDPSIEELFKQPLVDSFYDPTNGIDGDAVNILTNGDIVKMRNEPRDGYVEGWMFWSPGPDHVYDVDWKQYDPRITDITKQAFIGQVYDPTNGIESRGDIVRVRDGDRTLWPKIGKYRILSMITTRFQEDRAKLNAEEAQWLARRRNPLDNSSGR